MDSSNSGSFQSSSGGAGDNDEYDSTTQSISSYFNPTTNFNPNLNHLLQPQPPPPPPSSSSSYHHRPPSTNTTTFYTPSSFSLLQDPASPWTGTIRPQNNLPDFGSYNNPNNTTTTTTIDTQPKTGQHQIGVAIKNPKKRTRASRRAPTTVLTTDTTNFRQMVQEFTGIPTAPFTAAAPFSRRLDLFASTRPSAHNKIQPQPPPFLNSTANIVDSGTMNNNHHASAATSSANFHFAPSTIANFQKQPSTFLDLQNPMFSFQSLLQNSQSTDLTTSSSSKRWTSDPNGKLEAFEGVIGNTGGSKSENVLSAAAGGSGSGDQVQGNEASWICPSN
ncbi:putative VQ motif-containing protein [Helianthus debilis subsp. tardiflorus]